MSFFPVDPPMAGARVPQPPNGFRDSPAVAAARAQGRALVALESTIVAHGMPYPQNWETARAVEAIVREEGAEPATIALVDGEVRIGLDDERLHALARAGPAAAKVSTRDLGAVLAAGGFGATTVAATMACAHRAGIEVFVTGGIGGVHRGAERTMDVSADLLALARTPVAVVCAGAKAVLDLALTLEVLETHGVPVVAIGQDDFAAFWVRASGHRADRRVDDPRAQARLLRAHWGLGLDSGVVLSNPVPEAEALSRDAVEGWIGQALADAAAQGLGGKALTPFLLARIAALSGGRSLAANIALVKHNARVGARLAVALAAIAR